MPSAALGMTLALRAGMIPSRARSLSFALAFSTSAFVVVACGGRSLELGDGTGVGSSSGGSSSGSGSSGGSSGSSSGAGSSSSGGSSGSSSGGSSGSSSGSVGCPGVQPQGQCSENGLFCNYGGGCGTGCSCEGGEWLCYANPCPPPPPPPPPICPPIPPTGGNACPGEDDGLLCDYSNGATCNGEQCNCNGGIWNCVVLDCPPPPVCPTFPPPDQSSCSALGSSCSYFVNGDCNEESCVCDAPGNWSCSFSVGCPADAGMIVHP